MKIIRLERHLYAPELNRVLLDNGDEIVLPNVTSIKGAIIMLKIKHNIIIKG